MDNKFSFFATAPKGIEPVLEKELKDLGALKVKQTRAGASFEGNLETGYRACLWLRTANRVFLETGSFEAGTIEDLYEGIRAIDWSDHMSLDNSFAVDFHENESIVRHTHFGALKVKDAIVDQFRDRYNERPSVDIEFPDIRVNVYMKRRSVTVSIDLSGSSLHKRGYRSDKGLAPLKENLAAAILISAGWPDIAKKGGGFIDPMAGSGTLPIEAAMIAGGMAPGLLRDNFGFLKWQQHQQELWDRLLDEAEEIESLQRSSIVPVIGYDRDPAAIRDAIANVDRAGLNGLVHFEKCSLSGLTPHPRTINKPGLILTNPPYGERMGQSDDLRQLYSGLGERLRSCFRGWHAAVFTGNPKLAENIGLKPSKIDHFYNGSIPCELIQYRLKDERAGTEPDIQEILHRGSSGYQTSEDIKMFENRIKKNLKRVKSWRKVNNINSFRLYDRDIPEYAVAVDMYDQWVHVQEYRAPSTVSPEAAMKRLNDVVSVLPMVLGVPDHHVFLKQRRKQKRADQYEKLADRSKRVIVKESGLQFEIDLESYIDTGLFLDHRLTRSMIEGMAKGKKFLNLFSYTATATVYAARGEALSTASVDKSNTYTRWAKRNMALNGFDQSSHVFHTEDCLSWIKNEKARYDLIFLDPPTFSNTKKTGLTFDLQRDHANLILSVMELLADDGTLIFSNNFRQFKIDRNRLSHLKIEDITRSTISPDFERNPKVHNCWLIRM